MKSNNAHKKKKVNKKSEYIYSENIVDFSIKSNGKENTERAPLFFYFILVLIPILIIIFLELGLRIFNYGKNYEPFITINDFHPEYYFINPDLPFRYFGNVKNPPSVSADYFLKEKTSNTFRIFVLGGSTTAGWPFGRNAMFSRIIKQKLELIYPENNIEVINLGMSAVNSYTINDLISEIINNNPDLVLIYAGHNEFYGTLGVGSTESFSTNRSLIKLMLWAKSFKVTQLVENFILWIFNLFDSKKTNSNENETLMSRMIGENTIPLNSEIYNKGLAQFRENLDEILLSLSEKKINTIVGTLTSNLLQRPFSDLVLSNNSAASKHYNDAQNHLLESDSVSAKKYFILAKDHDEIKFRAPEEFSTIIRELSFTYNCPIANIDSAFSEVSKYNITGYNIMVDHLHPTVEGYKLMGKTFYETMIKNNFLPSNKGINFTSVKIDSLANANFHFTKLDSVEADLRIRLLTGSFPFVKKGNPNFLIKQFLPNDFIDTLAAFVVDQKISWQNAHLKAAEKYLDTNNYSNFIKEMKAVVNYMPLNEYYLAYTSKKLIDAEKYDDALYFLIRLYKVDPEEYSTKWIGSIYLTKQRYNDAVKFLEESLKYKPDDPQTLYNLAGTYFNLGKIDQALNVLETCLKIKLDYQQARLFYNQLKSAIKK